MKLPPPIFPIARRRPGLACWLMAAGCLLMLLAAAASLALGRMADRLESGIENRLVVQVADADAARRDEAAGKALAALRGAPGVVEVRTLGEAEAKRLIGPYIGGMDVADIPLPVLIDVTARSPGDVAVIGRGVRAINGVRAEPAGAGLAPLTKLVGALRRLGVGIALIAAAAVGALAVLAARSALAAEAATVAVLHGLGATDGQLARTITLGVARDAAIGVVIGALLAVPAVRIVGARLGELGVGAGLLDARAWAVLGVLALGLVALATAAAQIALLAILRRAR